MLVVLKCFQELVVLSKWLLTSCLAHVKVSVPKLLPPESSCLLPFVANISIDEFSQLFIAGDLAAFFEAQRLP